MGKSCLHLFSVVFDPIIFILACNEDMHKISDEFKLRPDRIADYGVSCPWGLNKLHRLIMGKRCLHGSSFIFDGIIIKVVGNQERHKSSDEFDFGPLVSMAHLYVFWKWEDVRFGLWMIKGSVLAHLRRPHFQTWISLFPVGQSWSNFICSITDVGERLHKVLGKIG